MHVSEILISLFHVYINVRLSGELKPNFSLETLIVKLKFKYLVCITRREKNGENPDIWKKNERMNRKQV